MTHLRYRNQHGISSVDEKAYWSFLQENYPTRYKAFYHHDAALKCYNVLSKYELMTQFEAVMSQNVDFMDTTMDAGDVLVTWAWIFGSVSTQLDGWAPDIYIRAVLNATALFAAPYLMTLTDGLSALSHDCHKRNMQPQFGFCFLSTSTRALRCRQLLPTSTRSGCKRLTAFPDNKYHTFNWA